MAAFYEDVIGLSVHEALAGGGMRLGWGRGHHVLDLLPGEPGIEYFGLEVRDPGGLDVVAGGAADSGLEARPLSDESFELRDPDGNVVQLHGRVERSGEVDAQPGHRPTRIQHVTVATTQVPELVAFYADVLGFTVSDRMEDVFVWLRCSPEHHTVAVVDSGGAVGLDHYAFEVAGWDDFKVWCDRLSDLGVPVRWGPGRHGPGNNLFVMFDDPDGNRVELSAELEHYRDDTAEYPPRAWEASPRTTNLWGGPAPDWRSG